MSVLDSSQARVILLVEDNPGDVRLVQEALQHRGSANRLETVCDGVEALAYLRREGQYAQAARPDLILLDLNLPRVNGREVLAEIKKDERLRRIPVVILTASRAEDDLQQAYDLHANCCIVKPTDFDQVIATVAAIEAFWLCLVTLAET